MSKVTRRMFVATMGAASVLPLAVSAAAKPETKISDHSGKPTYLFFNASEAGFIGEACERLIPVTDDGVGALTAGVPNYLDQQLGGAWGAGERLYRSGPWINGSPRKDINCPSRRRSCFTLRCAPSITTWNNAARRSQQCQHPW